MQTLFESHDAGRTLGVTGARIRQLVEEGKLVPAARTPRGVLLYDPAVVEVLRRARAKAGIARSGIGHGLKKASPLGE